MKYRVTQTISTLVHYQVVVEAQTENGAARRAALIPQEDWKIDILLPRGTLSDRFTMEISKE